MHCGVILGQRKRFEKESFVRVQDLKDLDGRRVKRMRLFLFIINKDRRYENV